MFKKINEAYSVIGDKEKRREYDNNRNMRDNFVSAPMSNFATQNIFDMMFSSMTPKQTKQVNEKVDMMSDFFENMIHMAANSPANQGNINFKSEPNMFVYGSESQVDLEDIHVDVFISLSKLTSDAVFQYKLRDPLYQRLQNQLNGRKSI